MFLPNALPSIRKAIIALLVAAAVATVGCGNGATAYDSAARQTPVAHITVELGDSRLREADMLFSELAQRHTLAYERLEQTPAPEGRLARQWLLSRDSHFVLSADTFLSASRMDVFAYSTGLSEQDRAILASLADVLSTTFGSDNVRIVVDWRKAH